MKIFYFAWLNKPKATQKQAKMSIPNKQHSLPPRKKNLTYSLFFEPFTKSFVVGVLLGFAFMAMPGLATTDYYNASNTSTDGQTWNYSVFLDDSNDVKPSEISHISLQTCFDSSELNPDGNLSTWDGVLTDASPSIQSIGEDGSTGYDDVIKWESGVDNSHSANFSITLDDEYGTGTALVIIKYGLKNNADGLDVIEVPGPNCEPVPDPANLTLVKEVTNDNGGTAVATDWTLQASGPDTISGTTGSVSVTDATVQPGTYTLSESGGPSGYTASDWSCDGGTLTANELTLSENDDVTCTITNDDNFVPEEPACPLKPAENRVIVNFPETWVLRSDKESDREHGPVPFSLSAGTYNITLASFDDHTDKLHQTQLEEQWHLELLNGTTSVFTSNDISDLPNSDNYITELVNTGAVVSINTDMIKVYHATDSTDSPNSIYPVCATFDKQPDEPEAYLTVVKNVVNDDGGTATVSNFDLFIDSTQVTSGDTQTLAPATYTVSEIMNVTGYTQTSISCDNGETGGTVTLEEGDDVTCTITNDDDPGTLIVAKTVVGGDKSAQDFSFSVNGDTALNFEADGQNELAVDAGKYTVTEPSVQYYDTTYNNCTDVVVVNGGTQTCEITNTYNPPASTITITKEVVNDNGGTGAVSDFTLKVNNTVVISGESNEFPAGEEYTISEVMNVSGYEQVSINCGGQNTDTFTLGVAENVECTIVNTDIQATLTLEKTVINDDGGTLEASDFDVFVDQTQVSWSQAISLDAGTYTVSEILTGQYTASDWSGDCSANGEITLVNGQNATCSITNDDSIPEPDPASLTIQKTVTGDTVETWSFNYTGDIITTLTDSDTSEIASNLSAGTYTVTEGSLADNWSLEGIFCEGTATENIAVSGSTVTVNLQEGEDVTCTFTNSYTAPPEPAFITLVKEVVNDDGRNATPEDFNLFVDSTQLSTGDTLEVNAGTYTVSETQLSGYTQESIVCTNGDSGGTVTIGEGEEVTCTITNNDNPTPPSNPSSPTLTIDKSVSVEVTEPGAVISYTIVVTNIGNASANNVLLEDDLPAGFTYLETGTNTRSWNLGNMFPGDSITRTYDVEVGSSVEPGDYVNTAIVSATNHGQRSDTASVRVGEVLGETAEPVLQITKVGDKEFVNPGGQITYTVTITNVGEATAINLVVTDTLPAEFTLAEDGSTTVSWSVPTLQVGESWETSFLVNIAEDIEMKEHVNVVEANAENYAGQLQASYTVEARSGEVLGETGAGNWAWLSMILGLFAAIAGFRGLKREFA
ncbi:MAG: NEW3 domain-containing protein [Candidatus Spechtbacterales bacterium]|nr:NEW3 domain-containing protein [Candidatus Spechtbacterales bacterium]